ncbi:MAG: DUF192 domain-containing protein [Planctomycetota bacterium]
MAARHLMLHVKAFVLLILVSTMVGCEGSGERTHEEVRIAGETFSLELVTDDAGRERGLGGRTEIPEGGGMMFVFPDAAERSFWMKDCVIAIDLIFLGPTGRVLAVHSMPAEEPRGPDETEFAYESRLTPYRSFGPAQYAIELEVGSISRLGVQVNDRIDLNFTDLKMLAR